VRAAAAASLALLLGAAPAALAQEAPEWRNTVYFYTYITHLEPTPETNEDLKWIGYSRTMQRDKWRFVNGLATYVDSYSVRSYSVFSDISHDDFTWGWVRPALGIQCHYKGKDYGSTERQVYCFPIPKLKFGGDKGLMANLAGTPKIGKLTNGWVTLELGYQW
jgi:hypothetical protein